MTGRAGHKGLRRIGKNDHLGRSGAARKRGAHFAAGWIDDGHRVSALVGDDESLAVGRQARGNGLVAGGDLRDFAAGLEIDDGNGIRAGVGYVGDGSGRVEIDRERLPVQRDGGHDRVVLGIDHRERAVGAAAPEFTT